MLATFDQQLWDEAKRAGLKVWPEERPGAGESAPHKNR